MIEPQFMYGVVVGVCGVAIVGGIITNQIALSRHPCKYCMTISGKREKTLRVYRMIRLPISRHDPSGMIKMRVYAFHVCQYDPDHVLLHEKTVFLTKEQLQFKPKEELEWSSERAKSLCERAGISNPSHQPFEVTLC